MARTRDLSDIRLVARAARDAASRGTPALLARVVAFRGFGGRRQGEALLLGEDGPVAGALLGGLADREVSAFLGDTTPDAARLVELPIGDTDAVSAGLACGGVATLLATRLETVPEAAFEALCAGRPVAIVTAVAGADRGPEAGASLGATLVVTEEPSGGRLVRHGTLGDPELDERAEASARTALRAGHDVSELSEAEFPGGRHLVVEAYLPTTTLVVVGEGGLVGALEAQGELLGWSVTAVSGFGDAEAELVSALGPSDAAVVLSHDPAVDTPALAAALRTGCYVGALGSRHTQSARRRRLQDLGFADDALDRIHGPVGLDLGTRTPEETAVAVAAEILAHRSGRLAVSLRDTSGPVNG